MKNCITIISCICFFLPVSHAQYAPQVGLTGSTAIHGSSSQFVGWATGCAVQRGYIDITDPGLGYVTAGDQANAVGNADLTIVSLGDNGTATLTFAAPLYDGPGADFAVFENGFQDPSDPQYAFIELAFVEVSSDGVNYYRFPAHSLVPDSPQIPGAGVHMNASLVNNLAGKYISGYGTPFDLADLAGTSGLDLDHITHVKLVDIIGITSGIGSIDTSGSVINDPYPTNFPTGGFDLDAVGAIHQHPTLVSSISHGVDISIYPNPVTDKLTIYSKTSSPLTVTLTDISGRIVSQHVVGGSVELNMSAYTPGLYYLLLQNEKGEKWSEKIVRQ